MPRYIHPLCYGRKLTFFTCVSIPPAVLNLLGCSIADRGVPLEGNYLSWSVLSGGDTLVMENGERVRLIGVDTPETKHPKKPVEHFGKEAAAFTRRIVEGKRIRLEIDPANAHRRHKDRTPYRRTLAHVFLENGLMLNSEIIAQGYGFADMRFPFFRMEEFRQLERMARDQRRGLWKSD